MGMYSENLDLRYKFENHQTKWVLLAPFSYQTDGGITYTAPVGFQTDLASIPQAFWSFLPPFWKYAKAAVIHDYLLAELKLDDRIVNYIFREGMNSLSVNKNQIFIIYHAVCFHFWYKKQKKSLYDFFKKYFN